MLCKIVDIDADERMVALVSFGLDDFDAAIAELESRYFAGEAAAYARTWPVIAGAYAALNRGEFPSTTSELVNIDHRGEIAFGPGDLIAYLRSGLELDQGITIYIEAVHLLADFGAAITYAADENSREGFDAEWRGIAVLTVDGEMVNRVEVFDEAELDAALARFDELQPPAPRLENAASRVYARLNAHLAVRNWAAMAETMAQSVIDDDRRRVVNSGIRSGRDAVIAGVRTAADLGAHNIASTVIATRGERLALCASPLLRSRPEARGVLQRGARHRRNRRRQRIVAARRVRPRRHRRRPRRTRRPVPRRRSGRIRAHMVGHRRCVRRFQPARAPRDDPRLGEHRPPSRSGFRPRRHDRVHPSSMGRLA